MREFDLLGFAAHLVAAEAAINHAEHKALERAAKLVEREAKEEIGHYQEGWPQLSESTKGDRERKGFPADEPLLRTGDLRDSIHHQVEGKEAVVGSESDVAVWQELGTAKIPPRSFLAGAAHRKGQQVAHIIGRGVVHSLVGDALGGSDDD
jgi:phage gpG-like protein